MIYHQISACGTQSLWATYILCGLKMPFLLRKRDMEVRSVSGMFIIKVISTKPRVAYLTLAWNVIWTYARMKDSTFQIILQPRKTMFCTMIQAQVQTLVSISLSVTHSKTLPLLLEVCLAFPSNIIIWHLILFLSTLNLSVTNWPNIQFPLLLGICFHILFIYQGLHSPILYAWP